MCSETPQGRAPRCAGCGARNPAEADWCGQCFATLTPRETATPTSMADAAPDTTTGTTTGTTGAPVPAPTGTAAAPNAGPAAAAPVPGPALGRVRSGAAGVEWSCRACHAWNPLGPSTCEVCGTAMALEPVAYEDVRDVRPEVLATASVLAPGAGHVLLGRTAEGVARLLLAGTWAVGGITLLRGAVASGRPVLPAVPLLVGWVVLAVGCTNDALVHGGVAGRELLHARALLWLTVTVVGLTAAGAVVGVLLVTGGGGSVVGAG